MQWRNNANPGYVYYGVDYEGYRSFARAVSKGQKVNTYLNGFTYSPMTGEQEAPSNERRRGVTSRLRT